MLVRSTEQMEAEATPSIRPATAAIEVWAQEPILGRRPDHLPPLARLP